ncbi:hypothetical protein GYMLUDRAFT_60411 [Collybiopsis luxurians FD-317 M1]|uniref:Uncharacterized protein n=1 Tax=Collybiopsis luxurians FD-317 M1 TaxID=944289 RepID=A0A0D0B638_9AGAR|nr:hypothetical protein GYMLUDRAFT_60411 [Collybiopsis luxurians FD-317 M1]
MSILEEVLTIPLQEVSVPASQPLHELYCLPDNTVKSMALNNAENEFLDNVMDHNDNLFAPDGRFDMTDSKNEEFPAIPENERDFAKDKGQGVQDISQNGKSKKKRTDKGGSSKILLSDFKDSKLTLFAKHCAQVSACVVNMCPEDPLV